MYDIFKEDMKRNIIDNIINNEKVYKTQLLDYYKIKIDTINASKVNMYDTLETELIDKDVDNYEISINLMYN